MARTNLDNQWKVIKLKKNVSIIAYLNVDGDVLSCCRPFVVHF